MVYSLLQVAPGYRWPFQQDDTHGRTELLSSRLKICYVKDVYTERWYLCKYWIQFLGICTQCWYPLIGTLQVLTYHQNHKSITSQFIIIRWYQPNSCAQVQSIQVLIGCVATWQLHDITTQLQHCYQVILDLCRCELDKGPLLADSNLNVVFRHLTIKALLHTENGRGYS